MASHRAHRPRRHQHRRRKLRRIPDRAEPRPTGTRRGVSKRRGVPFSRSAEFEPIRDFPGPKNSLTLRSAGLRSGVGCVLTFIAAYKSFEGCHEEMLLNFPNKNRYIKAMIIQTICIGVLICRRQGKTWTLEWIGVGDGFRRLGVGSHLIEWFIKHQNPQKFVITAGAADDAAAFFARYGIKKDASGTKLEASVAVRG